MKPASLHPVLWVEADPDRYSRYPTDLWMGDTFIQLHTGEPEPENGVQSVGAILDNPTTRTDPTLGNVASDVPLLLGLDVLVQHRHYNQHWTAAARWLPLLPVEYSPDLAMARDHIAAGAIGVPRLVEIVVPLGLDAAETGDLDHAAAASELEALVFGLHAVERVTGARVIASSWIRSEPPVLALRHQLEHHVQVVHRIQPTPMAPIAGFEAEVIGESGRIELRHPFAPGAVGIWRGDQPGYSFPATPQPKPDPQAPDSMRGGWDLTTLLHALLTPTTSNNPGTRGAPADVSGGSTVTGLHRRADGLRADALRLVDYVRAIRKGGQP